MRTQIEVGTRFGKLVTLGETFPVRIRSHVAPRGNVISYVGVQCDCGNTKLVRTASLNFGTTKSCGCLAIVALRIRNGIGEDGDCGHPECTGIHDGATRRGGELCPAAIERKRNGDRTRRAAGKRTKYVYACIVDNLTLKIGCSTQSYGRQVSNVRHFFSKRGFGRASDVVMIWHHVGDEGVETFLQWRAGRIWKHMVNSTRHSEWFDVTGVSPQDIVKHLRRWLSQVELLDQWDAEQQAAPAILTAGDGSKDGDSDGANEARLGAASDLVECGYELSLAYGLVPA